MTLIISLILSLCLSVCSLIAPPAMAASLVNQVVAVVEKDLITLDEVDERILDQLYNMEKTFSGDELKERKSKLRQAALEAMIDDQVAEAEAQSLGIRVSEEELDETIEDILKKNRISKDQLQRTLAMEGLTWDAYRNTLKRQILQSKLVFTILKPKIIIPEEEKRALYKTWSDRYKGISEVTLARIILSKDQGDLAKSLVDDLNSGADFAELAKEFSIAPDGKSGGLLGSFELDQLSPVLAEAVKNLKTGQNTGALESAGGFQIFEVVDVKNTAGKSFQDAEEELTDELTRQAITEKFKEWVKKVRQRRFVKLIEIKD